MKAFLFSLLSLSFLMQADTVTDTHLPFMIGTTGGITMCICAMEKQKLPLSAHTMFNVLHKKHILLPAFITAITFPVSNQCEDNNSNKAKPLTWTAWSVMGYSIATAGITAGIATDELVKKTVQRSHMQSVVKTAKISACIFMGTGLGYITYQMNKDL